MTEEEFEDNKNFLVTFDPLKQMINETHIKLIQR